MKFFIINFEDKRGSDKMLSMYWFAIVLLVSIGVFSMVYLFYSAPYEVRDVESDILANHVGNCLSRQGQIHPGIIPNGEFNPNFNLLRDCNLNFETEDEYDWKQEEQFFAEVEIYSISSGKNILGKVSEGNLNWKENCFIKDKKDEDFDRFVKCSEKRVYVLGSNSEQYLINILVGVGKIEKNARR